MAAELGVVVDAAVCGIPTFDAAWPDTNLNMNLDDVALAVKRLDITYNEAVRRIYRGEPKQPFKPIRVPPLSK